jgi:hypothetical protein
VELIDNLAAIPDDQETDLLRRSIFATRAIRMDWIDSEKPEPR